jgi:hypothetical protein
MSPRLAKPFFIAAKHFPAPDAIVTMHSLVLARVAAT